MAQTTNLQSSGDPTCGTDLLRGDPAPWTVLRSGRVLPDVQVPSSESSTPGGDLSTNAPPRPSSSDIMLQAMNELSRRLGDLTGSISASFLGGTATTSVDVGVPEFHGFRDDPVSWLQKIDAFATLHAWPEKVSDPSRELVSVALPKRRIFMMATHTRPWKAGGGH